MGIKLSWLHLINYIEKCTVAMVIKELWHYYFIKLTNLTFCDVTKRADIFKWKKILKQQFAYVTS